jgi:hypothetical protein
MSDLETKDAIGEEAPEVDTEEVEQVEGEVDNPEEGTVEKAVSVDDLKDFYNPKKKEEVKQKEEKVEEIKYTDFSLDKDLSLGDDFITEVKTFAQEKKLKQEEAQKVFDLAQAAIKKDRDAIDNIIIERAKAWDEAVRVDKEIGGVNIAEKMGVIKGFIKKFGNEEVREVFRKSGLGSHPEVLRLLYKAGKAFSEDDFVPNTGVKKPVSNKNEYGETMIRFPSLEKR